MSLSQISPVDCLGATDYPQYSSVGTTDYPQYSFVGDTFSRVFVEGEFSSIGSRSQISAVCVEPDSPVWVLGSHFPSLDGGAIFPQPGCVWKLNVHGVNLQGTLLPAPPVKEARLSRPTISFCLT